VQNVSDFYAVNVAFSADTCVSLLSIPEYRNLTQPAIYVFDHMPTTFLCEQGFSASVEIK